LGYSIKKIAWSWRESLETAHTNSLGELDFVYCILSFARSEYLRDLVKQIRDTDPHRKILILVDSDPLTSIELSIANAYTYEIATQLGMDPLIQVIDRPNENLGTKKALKRLIHEGFLLSPNIVYIEDDLRLVRNPVPYIQDVLKFLHESDEIGFGTLYSRYQHVDHKSPDAIRLSRWPELWGLIISQEKFEMLNPFDEDNPIELKSWLRIWHEKNFSQRIAIFTRRYFVRTWTSKFNRACKNRHAWDTIFHKQLWASDCLAALPSVSLVEDRGIDWTSVSRTKEVPITNLCTSLSQTRFNSPEGKNIYFCNFCELSVYIGRISISRRIRWILITAIKTFSKFSLVISIFRVSRHTQ
jgi:hypothetical protein